MKQNVKIAKELIKLAKSLIAKDIDEQTQRMQQLFNQFSKFSVKHPIKISNKEINNGVIEIYIYNDDVDGSEGMITISTQNNKLYIQVQLYKGWTYDPEAESISMTDTGHYLFHQSKSCKENIDISSQMLFQKINSLIKQVNKWFQDSIDQYEQQQSKYYEQLYSQIGRDDYYDDFDYYDQY